MQRAAVIGSPVSHSRSPAIFGYLAEQQELRAFRYSKIEVLSEELSAFIQGLRSDQEYVGFNVTIPHKETILPYLDQLSPEAQAIGAVNVVLRRDGKLLGFNTDVVGILKTLEENQINVAGQDVWIRGAGGAARAVAYALGTLKAARVYIFNRDPLRARALSIALGGLFPATEFQAPHSIEDVQSKGLKLFVNATSLGMTGGPIAPEFSELTLLPTTPDAVAFDLIYTPEPSPFLEQAARAGRQTIGGLGMLIDQAVATWEIWFGSLGSKSGSRAGLIKHLRSLIDGRPEDPRPIFLAGFMGVGKSTVASLMARTLGWDFVDLDRQIEIKAGKSISDIFESAGESAFRQLEAAEVALTAKQARTVVALGGGALQSSASLEVLLQQGHLVYLEADAGNLAVRLKHTADTRPLLRNLSPEQRLAKIQGMLQDRLPIYARAPIRVQTDGQTPDEVAQLVLRRLP